MNKDLKKILDISVRYAVSFASAFPNFWIFYFIFTPATIYSVFYSLSPFLDVSLIGYAISINQSLIIEIVEACVAGPAYYFLFVLNLSTPNIKFNKRVKMIALSFLILFIINYLRILFLSLIYLQNSSLFEFSHQIFWYLGSTVFVGGIWFYEVKLFRIKDIPFYSDLKFFLNKIKNKDQ